MSLRSAATAKRLVLIAWAVALLAATAVPAHAAFPGQNGKIAFLRDGDVWTMNSDGTDVNRLTSTPGSERSPHWSRDGTRIIYENVFGSGTDFSIVDENGTKLADVEVPDNGESPSWSPDGQKIVYLAFRTVCEPFCFHTYAGVYTANADGTGAQLVTDRYAESPVFSPDGTRIAFVSHRETTFGSRDIWVMNADGSGHVNLTHASDLNDDTDLAPDWSPNGSTIVFSRSHARCDDTGCSTNQELHTIRVDGTDPRTLTSTPDGEFDPAWSPDGGRIAYATAAGLFTIAASGGPPTPIGNGASPSWQPIPGYPRPQAGAQFRVALVVAYRQCTAPNRTHGPALNGPSCNPALPLSPWLTVGTMEANGFPQQMSGHFRLTVCKDGTTATGICSTPPAMTAPDVRAEVEVTDVRCVVGSPSQSSCEGAALSDYEGELEGEFAFRATDRHNSTSPGGTGDPATMVDLPFPVTVPCVANPAGATPTAIGGTCATVTRLNAIVPGGIQSRKRGNWQIEPLRVFDGGQGGIAGAPDETPFLRQGIFIP